MVVYDSGAYGMPPWGNADPRMMSQQWGMNMMGQGNDVIFFWAATDPHKI